MKLVSFLRVSGIMLLLACVGMGRASAQRPSVPPASSFDSVQNLQEVHIYQRVYKASALKLNVPVRFIPTPTNRLGSADLRLRQITDLQEATKQLPSVRTRTTYGAYQQIYIRGFDYSPILIDGMRDERSAINNSYPFPDIAAAEAVELVKGPAAVLYGRSSEGGIINIVRKKPSDVLTLDLRAGQGSWKDRRLNIGAGGPLAYGIKYYTNVYMSEKDGWRHTGDKRFSTYLALEKAFGDIGLLEFRAGFSRDHYGTENGLPPNMRWDVYNQKDELFLHTGEMLPGLNPRVRYNIPDEYTKNRAANLMLQYTHKFGKHVSLSHKIAYFDDLIDFKQTSDMMYPTRKDTPYKDGFYYRDKEGEKIYVDLAHIYFNNPWTFGYIARTISNQTELNVDVSTGSVKHHLSLGYAYSRMNRNAFRCYNKYENNKDYGQSIYGSVYDVQVPINHPENDKVEMMGTYRRLTATVDETHGVYLSNLVEIAPQFKLMLAGRYDGFVYRSLMKRIESQTMEFQMPLTSDMGQTKLGAFSYKAGAVWLPNSVFSLFGSVSSFYHPIRDLFNSNAVYINKAGKRFEPKDGGEIFKPESGRQFEIGTRINLDNRLTVTSSIYYTLKENVKRQLATFKENGITKTVMGQVGRIESKGGDIELHYEPTLYTALTIGYSYVDASVIELAKNAYVETESVKGLQLTDVPKHQFYARASHTFHQGYLRGLTVFGSTRFTDRIDRDRKLNLYYPSFWQLDAGISYAITRELSATINVYNLLDDRHYEQSVNTQMVPSDPRSLLFTLSYKL